MHEICHAFTYMKLALVMERELHVASIFGTGDISIVNAQRVLSSLWKSVYAHDIAISLCALGITSYRFLKTLARLAAATP